MPLEISLTLGYLNKHLFELCDYLTCNNADGYIDQALDDIKLNMSLNNSLLHT